MCECKHECVNGKCFYECVNVRIVRIVNVSYAAENANGAGEKPVCQVSCSQKLIMMLIIIIAVIKHLKSHPNSPTTKI